MKPYLSSVTAQWVEHCNHLKTEIFLVQFFIFSLRNGQGSAPNQSRKGKWEKGCPPSQRAAASVCSSEGAPFHSVPFLFKDSQHDRHWTIPFFFRLATPASSSGNTRCSFCIFTATGQRIEKNPEIIQRPPSFQKFLKVF